MIRAGGKAGISTHFLWTHTVQVLYKAYSLRIPKVSGMKRSPGAQSRNVAGSARCAARGTHLQRRAPARRRAAGRGRASRVRADAGVASSGLRAVDGAGGGSGQNSWAYFRRSLKSVDSWKLTERTLLLSLEKQPT